MALAPVVPQVPGGQADARYRDWVATSAPADGTAASITIAAIATVAHVLTSIEFHVANLSAATPQSLYLRVLDDVIAVWVGMVVTTATPGSTDKISISGLHIAITPGNKLVVSSDTPGSNLWRLTLAITGFDGNPI